MSLKRRIKKLEAAIEPDRDLVLYDSNGRVFGGRAEVIRWPTADTDGEALLEDGTKRPIKFNEFLKEQSVVVTDESSPKEPEEHLRIGRDLIHVTVRGV